MSFHNAHKKAIQGVIVLFAQEPDGERASLIVFVALVGGVMTDLVAEWATPVRVLLGSTHPVVTARGWYM